MPRRDDSHYDGTGLGGNSAQAVSLMHDEREWELRLDGDPIRIKTKKTRYLLTVVTDAPPQLRGHINGPVKNLERYLRTKGALTATRIA